MNTTMSSRGVRAMSSRRVRAIFRKELRDYRRNGHIVATMLILPAIFVIPPLINIFALPAQSAIALGHQDPLLYLLGIPALVPAAISAYSVVGERQQGTLEPVLSTPIRREEFVLGKALSALAPVARGRVSRLRAVRCRDGAVRQAGRRVGAAAGSGCTGPGGLHAVAGHLVDLARHRDLDASGRRARRAAARDARQPAVCRRGGARRLQRHPPLGPPRSRRRGAAAVPRRRRLADGIGDLRQRAAYRRPHGSEYPAEPHRFPANRCVRITASTMALL